MSTLTPTNWCRHFPLTNTRSSGSVSPQNGFYHKNWKANVLKINSLWHSVNVLLPMSMKMLLHKLRWILFIGISFCCKNARVTTLQNVFYSFNNDDILWFIWEFRCWKRALIDRLNAAIWHFIEKLIWSSAASLFDGIQAKRSRKVRRSVRVEWARWTGSLRGNRGDLRSTRIPSDHPQRIHSLNSPFIGIPAAHHINNNITHAECSRWTSFKSTVISIKACEMK